MDIPRTSDGEESVVEVERRFILDEHFGDRLRQLGARLVSERTFVDVYYDNESHDLVLNDHWLRRRDDLWQLKCPPGDRAAVGAGNTLHYAEFEKHTGILKRLELVLQVPQQSIDVTPDGSTVPADELFDKAPGLMSTHPSDSDSIESKLDVFLKRNCIKPFASFRTTRAKYLINDDIVVDLDEADFGYSVGEIEVMTKGDQPREEAVTKIAEVAKKLGVYGDEKIPAKLIVYLQRHNQRLYTLLRKTFHF